MRLVLRRAAIARALLIAAALAATVTTALLTAFLQYVQLLPNAGMPPAVQTKPPQERSVLISGGAGDNAADVAGREADIRQRFGRGLGGMPVTIAAGGYAIGQQLPHGFGQTVSGSGETFAVVAFLDHLPEHAQLVRGSWPEPVDRTQPAQVALSERAAATLRVGVDERVPIHDRRTGRPEPVMVVGIFRPLEPSDPYWQLAADPIASGGYGPLVVHRDEFLARYLLISTLQWVLAPNAVDLTSADLVAVSDAVAELRVDGIPGPDKAWFPTIRTELDDLARRLDTTRVVSRSGLVLPALLVIVIASYVLFLVARLLADQRSGELSMLRARGASRAQLARLAIGEALLVITPAAVLGAPLAAALLRLGDRWATGHGVQLAAAAGGGAVGSSQAWVIAVLAAAICAAALVVPAARSGRTWVAEQLQRSRPGRLSKIQRAGADAALAILALVAWLQLRQYAGPLTHVRGALDVDPLLVAAPAVGVLAATALSLRLLPAVTRIGVAATQRRTSFSWLLGMWRADRRPHAGPVLLLVLAVAAAALASCLAASWQRSQRDQAAHAVGADLRVALAGGSAERLSIGFFESAGVQAGTPVVRLRPNASKDRYEILGLNAAAAPEVVLLRADLAQPGAFALLAAGRPDLPAVVLPPDTRRLAGHVAYAAAPGSAAAELDTSSLTATVDDGAGTLAEVDLGELPADGSLDFDVPVPTALAAGSDNPRLIGLTFAASSHAPNSTDGISVTNRVRWRWDKLAAVNASGTATPVAIPAQWTARARSSDPSVAPPRGDLARSGVMLELTADLPATAAGTDVHYFVSAIDDARPAAAIPALATPQMLTQAGVGVGEDIRVVAGDPGEFQARIVGTVTTVPSSTTGAALLVDLPTLDVQRLLRYEPFDTPTEWWLATDPAQHDRVAAEFSARSEFAVADRAALARRLLSDPLGWGVLFALYVAVLSVTALAAFGLAVDARATSLRSSGELAVLYTLGTAPRALARMLVIEQSILAGLGVLSGLGVGMAVAAAMAPSMVLTERGGRPVPDVLLVVPLWQVTVPAVALFCVALTLGAAVARRARRDVAVDLLRIGADR